MRNQSREINRNLNTHAQCENESRPNQRDKRTGHKPVKRRRGNNDLSFSSCKKRLLLDMKVKPRIRKLLIFLWIQSTIHRIIKYSNRNRNEFHQPQSKIKGVVVQNIS